MQQRISPWQVLFYVSWSVLGLWLILKVTGVIKTPVWLEYGVPIASLLVGIVGIYQNVLEQLKVLAVNLAGLTAKVDHIDKDVETLKGDVGVLKSDVVVLTQRTARRADR